MLIETGQLSALIEKKSAVVLDCRFDLNDPERGREEYAEAHIPWAYYVHLDEDLSSKVIPGETGRHPLPTAAHVEALIRSLGVVKKSTVVVYDHANGGIAARAWWIMRWAGIEDVRLLNGGWSAWENAGLPMTNVVPSAGNSQFVIDRKHRPEIEMAGIPDFVKSTNSILLDARAADRYRGIAEPIDPVAGHIPGAINLPWMTNVDDHGMWLQPADIRKNFEEVASMTDTDVAVYCGSGVTACHLAFAYEFAGLGVAKLYAGSWSEWITGPDNPVATGDST